MSTIAVAGGTGTLGRAIVDELVGSKAFQVFVFAREVNVAKEKEMGVKMVAVNYNDVNSISEILEENKIDTVISTLGFTAGVNPELALIKAAEASSTTTRFIPSTWGLHYTPELVAKFPFAKHKADVLDCLEQTLLEYTAVMNGYFMDYFVSPHVKTYMSNMAPVIDMANNTAAIPASGDVPVVFTYSFDIGRFVTKLLKAPKWDKESFIIGDKVTWNEFLKIAEEAKGVKFDVTHDTLEALKRGQITELPSYQAMYAFFPKEQLLGIMASFGVLFAEGDFDFKSAPLLNDIYPDIKPRTVKELLNQAWKSS
ncbi:NAD(P)-binding protein [Curvularia clavata]|uniref:NAD(P)-binding protein n=1 Tax=Curvularia clavata TaxID=95742 RepID=A0A9Q8YZE7_CURCL|nr:NAD(P)-binding protein [Curvularia clavata]